MIVGVNGYQYSGSSNNCMLCLDLEACSACSEPRTLPWAQDVPIQIISEYSLNNFENESDATNACQSAGYVWNSYEDHCFEAYAWGLWETSLRDFVILDRNGVEVTRINLTGYNPDPDGVGECTGNYETIKSIILQTLDR